MLDTQAINIALKAIAKSAIRNLEIAAESVWAIGSGRAPHQSARRNLLPLVDCFTSR